MHFALLTWPGTGPAPHLLPHAGASPVRPTGLAPLSALFAALRPPLRRALAGIDLRLALAGLASLAGLLVPPLGDGTSGAHHAVDDTAIVEPGRRHLEASSEASRGHRLQHLGPARPLPGAEAGLNLDRDAAGAHGADPQLVTDR